MERCPIRDIESDCVALRLVERQEQSRGERWDVVDCDVWCRGGGRYLYDMA